jgi:hypothetical protein
MRGVRDAGCKGGPAKTPALVATYHLDVVVATTDTTI